MKPKPFCLSCRRGVELSWLRFEVVDKPRHARSVGVHGAVGLKGSVLVEVRLMTRVTAAIMLVCTQSLYSLAATGRIREGVLRLRNLENLAFSLSKKPNASLTDYL